MSFKYRVGAAAMALAALAAGTAAAQEERPQPTPCAGIAFTDPAGDQNSSAATVAGQPVGPPGKPKDNVDLIEGFLRYAPDGSGANKLTAVLSVTNMTKELEQGATGIAWYFSFTDGDKVRFVVASLDSAGKVTYGYGTTANNSNTTEGPTTGRFVEGPRGYVAIDVPIDKMGIEGKTVTEVNGQARVAYMGPPPANRGVVVTRDRAPDTGGGTDFVVSPCAEATKGTVATKSETPANDKPAGGGGGGSTAPTPTTGGGQSTGSGQSMGGGQPTVGGQATGVRPIRLRVLAGRISARKAKKRFSVRLIPGEAISGLRATLYTGKPAKPRVFATGRIAKLTKAGKLTLRVKRKLKAGTYTLALTGRNAAGQTSTVAVRLRVRR